MFKHYIMNIYDNIYKLAIVFQENLQNYLKQNPSQYKTMERIDESSFSKYFDETGFDFSQTAEDIEDDFSQPGASGVGITDDDGNVLGYVYGYNMTKDELPIESKITNEELINDYGIKFYTNIPPNFAKQFKKLIKERKIFYISNLALPEHKIKLFKMLKELLKKLKESGYEYVSFDALSDSMKLFMGEDKQPNQSRLNMFNVKLIAIIPDEGEWQHAQVLVKI